MELRTGRILRRSYRNIRKLLPSSEILSMEAFPRWAGSHPLSIVHNETTKTTTTPNEAAQEYKTALKHIAELYTFLSPILPTVEEAERTIEIYRQEGQEAANNQDLGGHQPEEEDMEEETEDQEEPQREEDQEGDQHTVRFNMDHLTEEEKEEEEKRIEADLAVVIATSDSDVPENREVPIPGVEAPKSPQIREENLPIRQKRRSSRDRQILQPFWVQKYL